MFDGQQTELLTNLESAHGMYYQARTFGGPSLHFHLRSLESSQAKNFDRFSEHVYALLASWGMHRMGPGGSKMKEFDEFSDSLQKVWPAALLLQEKTPDSLSDTDWDSLKAVFFGIRCMASSTSLVGNSKVMAHLIPNLIPPVDREYTLNFLYGNGQITNGLEVEWNILSTILRGFFYPIEKSPAFLSKTAEWLAHKKQYAWDTSHLKIIDNLIIGYTKMVRTEQNTPEGHSDGKTPPAPEH